MEKTCVIIAGPTAVGKTSLAIDLAKKYNTQIISADSRQCYNELNIGVAKPSASQLEAIHHYFINSHSIHEIVSAATFETYALNAVEEIFKSNDIAIMVGGTGLYIRAFTVGMDAIPEPDPLLRQRITADYKLHGLEWLKQQVLTNDPEYYSSSDNENPQRLMRALEIFHSTGQPFSFFRTGEKKARSFKVIKVGIELPREYLYERINERTDKMIADGLLEEAKSLYPFKHLPALQTVGYRELFEHFDGNHSFEDAVRFIKQNTRRYAKRQMTWFKKEENMHWLDATNAESVLNKISDLINSEK